tara:strand:- start:122 stop:1138 length:1017 start_codon:yes stop_codon:yes gene_type:complete
MDKYQNSKTPPLIWTPQQWDLLEQKVLSKINISRSEEKKKELAIKYARKVLRTHSTSFFIVTRFLPKGKRDQVELVYGSVRYPDEIVDSFKINASEKKSLLKEWRRNYHLSLKTDSFSESINNGVPILLAGFAEVVKSHNIPSHYYDSFLEAMELDVEPRNFKDLEDVIENYIFGSAIVVGYFLAYVYGHTPDSDFETTLRSSRNLGIALQLTNFVRDIHEDAKRGRIYVPTSVLKKFNIEVPDFLKRLNDPEILLVRNNLAKIAEDYYEESRKELNSFSSDSRIAIKCCTDLYRKLNNRIMTRSKSLVEQESLSWSEKLGSLPVSKYWKLPAAYLKL